MFRARIVRVVAGKVGYVVSCLLAVVLVVVSGYAHKVVSQVNALEKGYALNGGAVGPTTGPMNILVMGLESRTNFYGVPLPPALETALHSGDSGGQDPDTLILIHIFAGGRKAVGFSIPRDDLVTYPQIYDVADPAGGTIAISYGKIDNAYDWAYNESLDKTGSATHTDYDEANSAGQGAEIKVVESITGVTINGFIETNLAGFYYLAQAFGGVEVCLKPQEAGINSSNYENSNLYDYNSGFNAVKYDGYNLAKGGAQYLDLQADQALAFVRERDNLAEGDIDRTRRQQAVLDYVVYELKHENAFSDFGKLNTLLDAANQYLRTSPNLNLLDFATQMQALSGQNLSFQTLPSDPNVPQQMLPGLGTAQSVNTIDVPYLKRLVQAAFNPQPAQKAKAKSAPKKKVARVPAASTVTVDVYNGGSTGGLAANVQQALVSLGYKAGSVGNAPATPAVTAGTQVFYGAGASANAAKIATDFGASARALTSLPAQNVEVLLGTSSTVVPAGLAPSASASGSATPSASAASSPPAGTESGGGTLTVSPQAKYGIPCVY